LGEAGERIGAWFLTSHGLAVTNTNVNVDRGELDLIGWDGDQLVVTEVRSVSSGIDPIDAIDAAKRRRVERLANKLGADRVDYLGVGFTDTHVDFHWVPGSN